MMTKFQILVFVCLSGIINAQVSSGINYEKQSCIKPLSPSIIGFNGFIKKPISMQKPVMALPIVEFDIRTMLIFQYIWVPSMYNDKYQGAGLGIGLRLAGNENLFVPFVGLDLDFGGAGSGSPGDNYSYLFLRGSAGIRPQYFPFKPSFAVGGSIMLNDLELYIHVDAELAFHIPLNYYTDIRASMNIGHSIPGDGSYYDERNIMFLPKIGVTFHTN
ncbi:MAG: hypothetical protein ACKO6J_02270 [Crocinitomicaceae bacterium]